MPSDKERLNYLDKSMGANIEPSFVAGPWVYITNAGGRHNYDSLRLAIDAAMKAEKSSRRNRRPSK